MIILVKKGMAQKAFLNNVKNNDLKKLKAQIEKGTIKPKS